MSTWWLAQLCLVAQPVAFVAGASVRAPISSEEDNGAVVVSG